jgi:asparagine synthase (glutamine-hydrolysing)
LSGGIDSSAVTMMAARTVKGIRSFSIGFEGTERDETPFAGIVASQAGTVHQVHHIKQEEMSDVARRLAGWFDEPFGDSSAIPTFRVCAVARQTVTVALSGDGGDELFGGYRWYPRYNHLRRLQRFMPIKSAKGVGIPPWFPGARKLQMLSVSDPVRLWALLRGGTKPEKLLAWKRKLGVDLAYDELWAYRAHFKPELSPRLNARIMDFHTYLPDDILTKVDRTSMAVSLECRPPFLSRAMIEFAFSLPEDFLYLKGDLKGGLKMALTGVLPEAILNRGKQGFGVPDFGWKKQLAKRHGSFSEALVYEFLGG